MQLSYWEIKNWFTNVDYTVVGSGIVGLHAALRLRERFPKSKIIVLEKGVLPQGASTKNAGFACFGSLSEIIDDLKSHSEEEVINLIQKRWEGLKLLRKRIGDEKLDFKHVSSSVTFFCSLIHVREVDELDPALKVAQKFTMKLAVLPSC